MKKFITALLLFVFLSSPTEVFANNHNRPPAKQHQHNSQKKRPPQNNSNKKSNQHHHNNNVQHHPQNANVHLQQPKKNPQPKHNTPPPPPPEPIYSLGVNHYISKSSFTGCNEHFLITDKSVENFSDGSYDVSYYYTLVNAYDAVLSAGFSEVTHLTVDGNHFLVLRYSGLFKSSYQILNGEGISRTGNKYTDLKILPHNLMYVKYDKKFGIIDAYENQILPIKYSSLKKVNDHLYISELYDGYGLVTIYGEEKLSPKHDKISQMDGLLKVKKDGKYGVADANGKLIVPVQYKKVRLKGGNIQVKTDRGWQDI